MACENDYLNDDIAKTLKCDWKKCRECVAESYRHREGWYEKFITGGWSLAYTTKVACPEIHSGRPDHYPPHDMALEPPDYCPHKEHHNEFSENNKKEVSNETGNSI